MIREWGLTWIVRVPLQGVGYPTCLVQGNWHAPRVLGISLPRVLAKPPHPLPRKGSFLLELHIELYVDRGLGPLQISLHVVDQHRTKVRLETTPLYG